MRKILDLIFGTTGNHPMLGWGTLFLRIFVSALMLKVHELLPWERRTDKGLLCCLHHSAMGHTRIYDKI